MHPMQDVQGCARRSVRVRIARSKVASQKSRAQSGHLFPNNLLLQPTWALTRQCAIEKMHSMNDSQPLLDFDPDFCRKIAKWGAVICLAWLGVAICVLALVHPGSQCPAWTIHDKNGGATSLWVIVGFFIGFPTIWL